MLAPAMLRCAATLAVLLLAAASPTAAFYLPGVAPNDFSKVGYLVGSLLLLSPRSTN
jgi:hypothetical protein